MSLPKELLSQVFNQIIEPYQVDLRQHIKPRHNVKGLQLRLVSRSWKEALDDALVKNFERVAHINENCLFDIQSRDFLAHIWLNKTRTIKISESIWTKILIGCMGFAELEYIIISAESTIGVTTEAEVPQRKLREDLQRRCNRVAKALFSQREQIGSVGHAWSTGITVKLETITIIDWDGSTITNSQDIPPFNQSDVR